MMVYGMNRIEGTIVVVNVPKALAAIKRYASQNESCASISKAIQLEQRDFFAASSVVFQYSAMSFQ